MNASQTILDYGQGTATLYSSDTSPVILGRLPHIAAVRLGSPSDSFARGITHNTPPMEIPRTAAPLLGGSVNDKKRGLPRS